MQQLQTTEDIITRSEDLFLYKKLVLQLKKDFLRAAIQIELSEDISPKDLKYLLQETLFNLLQEQSSDYLNLLYIIDVSEEKIKQVKGDDILKITEQVSYLILLREWQKVWFRSSFQK